MLNVPVTNNFALRGVVYLDERGGYIDNVRGTRDASESGRFRPAGTVRANGVPVSANRQGFQAGADLSGVNFLTADNQGRVEDDFNDTRYAGFRASALWEISPDWTINVSHSRQSIESDGVFFADPELDGLDDLQIQRFQDDRIEDSFSNTAWTVEGRLGLLDIVYSGAYTDRKTEQQVDYSDYLFVGQYLPYYICDTAVAYPSYATPISDPTCQAPNLNVSSRTKTSVFTQEFRVNTPEEAPIRLNLGGFYSRLVLEELNDFNYTGSPFVRGADGVTTGFLPNYPLTNLSAPPGATGNATDGYFSEAGPFPTGSSFRNDIRRTDRQIGLFGEASVDVVPDLLTITAGARYYDVEVDLEGSANSTFFNLNSAIFGPNAGAAPGTGVDAQLGGTNISAQFAPDNTVGAPDKAKTSGVIFKGTVTLTPSDNVLLYATYSEGFRPGLLNRPGGAQGPGGFTVPFALDTDEVKNYEFGWKTDIFDRQLRLNGSAFYVDISRLQTTIFDPSISNLFFSDNAANAEILGIEGDFIFAPYAVPGLTIAGAVSFLDTKITEVLTPTDDVIVGSDLAFAPAFQGNLRVRYEWSLSRDMDAHIMPQVSHSSSKFTDIIEINKLQLNSYTIANISAGISTSTWRLEAYADNVFETRAEISGNFIFDRARIVTNRPLTVGLRAGFNF